MGVWQWLIGIFVVLGVCAVYFRGDRFCLWLEDRGLIYYRRKKPSGGGGGGGGWIAIQQFVEPSVEHVVQVKQVKRSAVDENAGKERALANLLAALDAVAINPETIRYYLSLAQSGGLNWMELYDEAVRVQKARRPGGGACIPSAEEVAPGG